MAHSNGVILLPELMLELFRILLVIDDGVTLEQCMLVCQTWLSLCRPLRFRRFKFKGLIKDNSRLFSRTVDGPRKRDRTFADFVIFLQGSPRLRSCITELQLETKYPTISRYGLQLKPIESGLEVELLWQIVAFVPRLRILDLTIASLDFSAPSLPSQPCPVLTLERLTLQNRIGGLCKIPSGSHLSYFLQSFDFIRHLVLGRTAIKSLPPPIGGRSQKVRVEQLTLRGNYSDTLQVSLDPAHLSRLEIRPDSRENIPFPFDVFSHNLRELRFGRLAYRHDPAESLNLSGCSKLVTLEFLIILYVNMTGDGINIPDVGHEGWDAACHMVSLVPSSTLRELNLVFEPRQIFGTESDSTIRELIETQLNRLDWSLLESVLNKQRLLERVRFHVNLSGNRWGNIILGEKKRDLALKVISDYIQRRYSRGQRIRELLQIEYPPLLAIRDIQSHTAGSEGSIVEATEDSYSRQFFPSFQQLEATSRSLEQPSTISINNIATASTAHMYV